MDEYNCSFCGKQFIQPHPNTKLCSDECKVASRRAVANKHRLTKYEPRPKLPAVCEYCKKTFIQKKAGTRFCSDLCRWRIASNKKSERINKFRKCHKCGIQLDNKPGYAVCESCRVDKRNLAKATEKERRRRFRKYGITEEQYDQMLEAQGHQCAICKISEPSSKGWQIDHCHSSMKVRGILCHHCNTALGSFYDDVSRLQSAIAYLRRFDV